MKKRPSRTSITGSIVAKDLREFSRDRLWMILTPASLTFVIALFWVLPDTVDETITVGLYPRELADAMKSLGGRTESPAQGLEVVAFDEKDRLVAAVSGELEDKEAKKISIGVAFPDGFVAALHAREKTAVSLYVDGAVPEEIRRALSSAVREIAYAMDAVATGRDPTQALPVIMPDDRMIILGEDRGGAQVPLREKLRPMMAVLILLIEALALAGLVAVEIQQRTVTALLVTPARTGDLLAAKGVTGVILGMGQAFLFLLATKSFAGNWLLVTSLMLLGAIMMSAVGMISGAAGKDFISTLFYGTALITPLMIPAFAVLFPGSASLWVKALPSYGLIQAMVGAMGYGRSWSELAQYMGMILAWDIVLFGAALLILKRKVEKL